MFSAGLGLRGHGGFSVAAAGGGSSLLGARGLLPVVAGFSDCVARVQQLWHTGLAAPRDVRPSQNRIKPESPVLAGQFFTTESPSPELISDVGRLVLPEWQALCEPQEAAAHLALRACKASGL